MGTGQVVDTMDPLKQSADGNWVKAFFTVPVEKEPGTHFLYNTGATYMLSAILQKVTGQTLLEYLEPRLFTPLVSVVPLGNPVPVELTLADTV